MQQLLYCCFDEPYWEADDNNPYKKTTGPSRRTLSRRTGRLSERQEYNPANIALRLMAEKAKRKGRTIYNCFDCINHKATWAVLQSYGVKNGNENAQAAVRVNNELWEWFNVRKGTRQGDPISP